MLGQLGKGYFVFYYISDISITSAHLFMFTTEFKKKFSIGRFHYGLQEFTESSFMSTRGITIYMFFLSLLVGLFCFFLLLLLLLSFSVFAPTMFSPPHLYYCNTTMIPGHYEITAIIIFTWQI